MSCSQISVWDEYRWLGNKCVCTHASNEKLKHIQEIINWLLLKVRVHFQSFKMRS